MIRSAFHGGPQSQHFFVRVRNESRNWENERGKEGGNARVRNRVKKGSKLLGRAQPKLRHALYSIPIAIVGPRLRYTLTGFLLLGYGIEYGIVLHLSICRFEYPFESRH